MLQLIARYKGIIVVGVLLAMPLVLLYAQTKKPGARGPIVGVFVDVAAGLERALLWTVGGLLDGLEHYATSVASYDELVALRRGQTSAAQMQTRIGELERENETLRSLANAVQSIEGPRPIGARVIARKGAPLARLMTLDVGTADGVQRGDGVIDRHGVVGQVLAVGRRACDVLLVTDSSSAIDVVIQRTRARGILRGEGSSDRYGTRVEDFDKLRDVRPGDAIVTSGLGARFPPGVLVGTVIDAEAPDDSLYLRAVVRPAVSFESVEHVSVLIDRPVPKAPRLGREQDELIEPSDADAGVADAGPVPLPRFGAGDKRVDAGTLVDAGVALDAGGDVAVMGDAGAPTAATADGGTQ